MIVRATTATVVIALVGCGATVLPQQPKYQTGSFPDIGVRTNVNVGQVMVTKFDYLAQGGAILRDAVAGSFWMGRDDLVAGTQLISSTSSGTAIFCQSPARLGAPCLKDTNEDGRFDHAYTINAYGFLDNEVEIPPADYRVGDQSIQDGFKYELIYQGIDNGVVRIAYREYTEHLARPAFSQDLTYTLQSDIETQVRFREVSAVIHKADNNQIEYTVKTGF